MVPWGFDVGFWGLTSWVPGKFALRRPGQQPHCSPNASHHSAAWCHETRRHLAEGRFQRGQNTSQDRRSVGIRGAGQGVLACLGVWAKSHMSRRERAYIIGFTASTINVGFRGFIRVAVGMQAAEGLQGTSMASPCRRLHVSAAGH